MVTLVSTNSQQIRIEWFVAATKSIPFSIWWFDTVLSSYKLGSSVISIFSYRFSAIIFLNTENIAFANNKPKINSILVVRLKYFIVSKISSF